MKYIVYCTTNLINNKIYIGVHKIDPKQVNDYYLGCGCFSNSPKSYNKRNTAFCCAVSKYGPSNFKRETIKEFDTLEEALELEKEIVNKTFLKRKDIYNQIEGGGYPPTLEKKVYQYNLNGYFMMEWKSIKSITNYFNINKDRINMVIKSKRSFNACYWSYKYVIRLDTSNYRPSSRGSIRVFSKDKKLLYNFENTTKAAEFLNIRREKITNAIYGKYATNNYYFLKEDEDIETYLSKNNKNQHIFQYDENGSLLNEYNNVAEIRKKI